jgi:tetratricopeptide (TPR) repeat protein
MTLPSARYAVCAVLALLAAPATSQTGPAETEAAAATLARRLLESSPAERAAALASGGLASQALAAALLTEADQALARADRLMVPAYEAAELVARQAGAERERGRALNGLAATLLGSELDRARAYAAESVRLHESLNDVEGLAEAWNCVSNVHYYAGEYTEAIVAAGKALEWWTAAGNRTGMARALGNMGNNESALGNLDEAEGYLQRAGTLFEGSGTAGGRRSWPATSECCTTGEGTTRKRSSTPGAASPCGRPSAIRS